MHRSPSMLQKQIDLTSIEQAPKVPEEFKLSPT
jgi:hypothetical protein